MRAFFSIVKDTAGRWLFVCAWLWLAGGGRAMAQETPKVPDYQVKAVYLYNFTKFINWPASGFTSADAPIVIGILGDDPFGKTLDDLVRGEIVHGHPLVIKRLTAGDDLQSCQVLFIGHSENGRVPALLQKLKGSPTLTVSDDNGFVDQGGMVSFVLVQEKVKLEINATAAEDAGLQISAKLLKLAVRVVKPL